MRHIYLLLIVFCFSLAGTHAAEKAYISRVSLNQTEIPRYEKCEATVFIEELEYENPYNPQQVNLQARFTSPSGKSWQQFGFYDGEQWKVRFSPNETGVWHGRVRVINRGTTARSDRFSFRCVPSEHHGWIRQSDTDPHYFVHDDGTSWFGVGHCNHVSKVDFGKKPMLDEIGPRKMKGYDLNSLVHWIFHDHPIESMGKDMDGDPFENTGVGRYDQRNARWIDRLVEKAEELDIKLIFVIWFHSQFYDKYAYGWDEGRIRNAYHTIHDDNLKAKEWAADPKSWKYQRRRYRYLIARWGYSRAVSMWNLMVELDLTPFPNKEKWLRKTHRYFKENDPFGHPTMVSACGSSWKPKFYRVVDVPTYHSYGTQPLRTRVNQLMEATLRMREFGKPSFISEYGTDVQELLPDFWHHVNWSCSLGGAAMSPHYWLSGGKFYGDAVWDKLYSGKTDTLPPEKTYLEHQQVLADFVKDIPFGKVRLQPLKPDSISFTPSEGEEDDRVTGPYAESIQPPRGWGGTQPGLLILRKKGVLLGRSRRINQFVHGESRDLHAPLVFGGRFAEDARLHIKIPRCSRHGKSVPTVLVDGETVFRKSLTGGKRVGEHARKVDSTFTAHIPEGLHLVEVANSAFSWYRMEQLRFENVLPATEKDVQNLRKRSTVPMKEESPYMEHAANEPGLYGMRSERVTFFYLMRPEKLQKLRIPGFPKGERYRVTWINTWTGAELGSFMQQAEQGRLTLDVPDSRRSLACKIRRQGGR